MILALLDQAYDRPSWHGTNLRGSLRRVTPRAGGVASRPGSPQHLGDCGSRRLLEVRRVAAPDRCDERIVPAEGIELVQAPGRALGGGMARRPRAARRNAPRAARLGQAPAGRCLRPNAERQQGEQLRAPVRSRRARPLSRRPDSVAEASGPAARMIPSMRAIITIGLAALGRAHRGRAAAAAAGNRPDERRDHRVHRQAAEGRDQRSADQSRRRRRLSRRGLRSVPAEGREAGCRPARSPHDRGVSDARGRGHARHRRAPRRRAARSEEHDRPRQQNRRRREPPGRQGRRHHHPRADAALVERARNRHQVHDHPVRIPENRLPLRQGETR